MGTDLDIVPDRYTLVHDFGKGDEAKAKNYLLLLASFLVGRPINTRRTYKCGLQQFFTLFEWICPEDVTPAHIAAFKRWLMEAKKVSDSTAYYRISAVSSFFDYLCKQAPDGKSEPMLRSNPCKHVPKSDIQPSPYSRSVAMKWPVFNQILKAIPPDAQGLRDKAILLFFAFTGRRRAEVANLLVKDLDLKSRPRTYTAKLKGGRVQTFELPQVVYDAIVAYWIADNRLSDMEPDDAVFTAVFDSYIVEVSREDDRTPLCYAHFNDILIRAIVRAGLELGPGMNIHAIRHMAARELDAGGVRLQDIQAFLGHSSPATTQLYLDRLSGPASAHTDVLVRVREEALKQAQAAAGLSGSGTTR